ncbi:MAG: cysteine dioxygenase family protein [Burkholderiales bacterium]|nr:cysteine dioxygenase family protein [Burkholderiales bacterium]
MKVHELVARCALASESADPMASIREVLEGLRGDIVEIERALHYISGTGGNANQVFYRSPDLTLLKVRFPNGRRTPPHDHGTWASILLLSGAEKNTLYRTDNGTLRKASEVTLAPGQILSMRADTAHVAECLGEQPTIGLHVYGGDIFALARRMWNPQTLEAHPLDWGLYENFARMASAAASAPAP